MPPPPAGEPSRTPPRPPATLTVATVLYVLIAIPGLVSQLLDFAKQPDENAPTSPFVVPQDQTPVWVGLLAPILLILLALLLREGRNGIRVTLTIISALLGLVGVGELVDQQDSLSVAAGVITLVLVLSAPFLLYSPTSNAYVRQMRRLRRQRA